MTRLLVRRSIRTSGFLAIAALLAASAIPASAYYHFVHYLNGGNAPEKFDLTVLPGKTVTFFVSQNGPAIYSRTDTFNSVLSQIRQATGVWNSVATSDLRVAFGGLGTSNALQNTPGGDVVFEDLPPGVYGYGGPTSLAAPVTNAAGSTFVPIARSTVHLNRNVTILPGPSYNETFYMTVVHEMGHALGLQHTFTSSTMSTATTRATNLSHAIEADDIAGISLLYPNAAFSQFGSITGRVTVGGKGAHLASVVAIRGGSGAVSTLTNADGSYRIDGIPAGQYFVYAHALPPDADIRGPWNPDGSAVASSGPTNALFYPGTTNLQNATAVSVQPNRAFDGVNIALASRPSLDMYSVGVYGYFNNNTVAIKPAYVNMLNGNTTVVASGIGLGANGQAPGLNAQFLGGSAYFQQNGVRPYQASGFTYVALDMSFSLGGSPGPQHLVFTTPNFMYVLPAGINITTKAPPTVTSVAQNTDGTTLQVTGDNWAADTAIYFDGLPSTIVSLDVKAGVASVIPPPGASGQTSTLTAYNTDGQNSQFVQGGSPTTWTYASAPSPTIVSISPSSLPAGSEAMVEIIGSGFNFTQGLMTIGFGSSDVLVRKIFVTGPNRVLVDVAVAPGAALANPDISVIAGFQVAVAGAGFQIAPAVPGLPVPTPNVQNAINGLNGIYSGAVISLNGTNLVAAGGTPTVSFNGANAAVLTSTPTQLNVIVPDNMPLGPVTMLLNNGAQNAFPLAINIDPQPAGIASIQNLTGGYVDPRNVAHPGDFLTITMSNFGSGATTISTDRVQVSVGGVLHKAVVMALTPAGQWQISFLLNASDQVGPAQTVIVYLDGHSSYPAVMPVAHSDGSFIIDPVTPTDGTEG